jgi:PAS domain S-box-containing protein
VAIILVVDDRPENRAFLTTLLGYAGHRVLEARDGAEALETARGQPPDLIITDLLMPSMDGFEFVRRLRTEPALAGVPVVFYTATYLEADARGLAEAVGVRHILTKPAEPETVLRLVNEVLAIQAPPPDAPLPAEAFQSEHLRLLTMTLAHKAEVVVPRLSAIIELSLELSSELDPSKLLDRFCTGARKILGARYALVCLVKSVHLDDLRLYSSGLDDGARAWLPPSWEPSGALAGVIQERKALRIDGGGTGAGLPPGLPAASSFLVSPLHSPGNVYGCLCLADRIGSGAFSEEEEQLAFILSGLAGRIYENGSLYAATKRHAEQLARSEQRFRQLAENIPQVFWMIQVHPFELLYVSPAYETVWGRSVASLMAAPRSWLDAVLAEDRASTLAFFDRSLRGEETSAEFRIRRSDGATRWIWARAFPVRENSGPVQRVTGISLDITDRRNLDEQLRQAQKMEAVGRLAGGVAHDFNNLLGVIMGYSEATLRTLGPEHRSRANIEEVLRATERAAGVTRQLLMFSRKQVTAPRVLDLNAIVRDLEKILRRLIGEDLELRIACRPSLGRIRADSGEIEQVIMNLAVNARDAMPYGGRLTIETEDVDVSEEGRGETDLPPGAYVRLTVTDTGTGIPKDIQANIFEPFFTTKEPGRGTGLGLSTVYGIVKQWGAHISVRSEAGAGACFRIHFPRVDAADDPTRASSSAIPKGTETILLVEDEAMLRTVAREMLEDCGYAVLEAGDGDRALQLASAHQGPIHLVITDVIMPGVSGPETAARLRRVRSGIKVLFVSGYTDSALAQHSMLPADVALLQKPFTAGSLARKVREVLDGA